MGLGVVPRFNAGAQLSFSDHSLSPASLILECKSLPKHHNFEGMRQSPLKLLCPILPFVSQGWGI